MIAAGLDVLRLGRLHDTTLKTFKCKHNIDSFTMEAVQVHPVSDAAQLDLDIP
jgi:hypothetical protein